MRAVARFYGLLLAKVSLVAAVAAVGAEAQDSGTFTQGIRPIMERSCWNCHNADTQRSDLDLSTRESALRGGRSGQAAIVPGRAEDSRMFRLVAGLEGPSMPREGSSLSPDEIEVLRAWINDGAHWDSGPAEAAGLAAGDLIVSLAGQTIADIYDYTYALDVLRVVEPAEVVFLRSGERIVSELVPEARE